MAQSTNPEQSTRTRKGPQETLVDAASLEAMIAADKNKQLAFMVHPALAVEIIKKVASDPANVLSEDGKQTLKRAAYTRFLQQTVADAVSYTGELVKPSLRGGNVIGIVSSFNSIVRGMFAFAQAMAPSSGMNEDQLKAFAFDQAKLAVAANPSLASITVSDEVLNTIWAGADAQLELDDDDEEEDDETPVAAQAAS